MKALVLSLFLLTSCLRAQDFSNKTLAYPFYPHANTTGETYKNLSQGDLCQVGYTSTVRNVTTYTKHQVYAMYGVEAGHYREVEVDHFISLELGGDNDLVNLWAEPYECYLVVNGENLRMGAREKDVVETNLHRRVCSGEITLAQAQVTITTDWVTYYLQLKGKI